jgi:hypothetical protein
MRYTKPAEKTKKPSAVSGSRLVAVISAFFVTLKGLSGEIEMGYKRNGQLREKNWEKSPL